MSSNAVAGPTGSFTVGSAVCCELDDDAAGSFGVSRDSREQAAVNASAMTLAPTANAVLISTQGVFMRGL
ncbi:hypothetical protein [Mycobacteroides abscessus]|uniref:hypothetical protein n=1 Tax=Mycobacteroides abscessus TaxID=36809 RepID=UPI00311AAED5